MAIAPSDHRSDGLAAIEIFRDLDRTGLASVIRRCQHRSFAAGQQIVGQADESREVYFILSGRVRVNVFSPDGRDVTFRDLGPGEMFGEIAAIDSGPRSANCIALADSAVASLGPAEFRQVLRDHPAVADAILRRLARLVRALSDRVYEFATLAVRNRIHAELLRLSRERMTGANRATLDPAPTHAEIASRIATHREAVSREISELTRARLIAREGHALVVLDVDRLADLVENPSDS
ncbi:MAG TPA: Crp/Fnr family transcriptional regulator [Alphaproteobacteria bacterium]